MAASGPRPWTEAAPFHCKPRKNNLITFKL